MVIENVIVLLGLDLKLGTGGIFGVSIRILDYLY
jgi:hypothetical protein